MQKTLQNKKSHQQKRNKSIYYLVVFQQNKADKEREREDTERIFIDSREITRKINNILNYIKTKLYIFFCRDPSSFCFCCSVNLFGCFQFCKKKQKKKHKFEMTSIEYNFK